MELIHEHVLKVCRERSLVRQGDRILVAVSGGPDSTALLHILNDLKSMLGIELAVAHFHHGLRGETADRDALFVKNLSGDLELPFIMEYGDAPAYQKESGFSRQEAARVLRLQFLERARCSLGAGKIVLGHTKDDQVEELLMRLIRGVGPDSLTGMHMMRDGMVIRPLLRIPKVEILRFLEKRGLSFMEDESNRDVHYLRNRIRHQVLPLLRTINPALDEALHRLSLLAEGDDDYWTREQANLWASLSIYESDGLVVLQRAGLRRQHTALASRLVRNAVCRLKGSLRSLTYAHVSAVLSAIQGKRANMHLDLPAGVSVDVTYGEVAFSLHEKFARFNLVMEHPGTLVMKEIQSRLTLEQSPPPDRQGLGLGPWQAVIDTEGVSWPLTVRTTTPGDRMETLGLGGTKKLKDLFMDRKIPRWKRPLLPILESCGSILWVAGVGLAEAAKVKPQTKQTLHIRYEGPLSVGLT
jgi:tRNA(Ile)-lysidine synthase